MCFIKDLPTFLYINRNRIVRKVLRGKIFKRWWLVWYWEEHLKSQEVSFPDTELKKTEGTITQWGVVGEEILTQKATTEPRGKLQLMCKWTPNASRSPTVTQSRSLLCRSPETSLSQTPILIQQILIECLLWANFSRVPVVS